MKVCIVGGTGNISASSVHLLLKQGHEVICANRGQSGPVPDGARWLKINRRDRDAFEQVMLAERFDAGGRIPDTDEIMWEDEIIAAQKRVNPAGTGR